MLGSVVARLVDGAVELTIPTVVDGTGSGSHGTHAVGSFVRSEAASLTVSTPQMFTHKRLSGMTTVIVYIAPVQHHPKIKHTRWYEITYCALPCINRGAVNDSLTNSTPGYVHKLNSIVVLEAMPDIESKHGSSITC